MNAQQILAELEARNVVVVAAEDRLRFYPQSRVPTELLSELQVHKAEILSALQHSPATLWPPESLESERRFGCPEAWLFPFLEKRVLTPDGPGRLVQVFSERVAVILESNPSQLSFFVPSDIAPAGSELALSLPLEVPH